MPSTREMIIDTADALFYRRGFEATSFGDIGGALGMSRGNFYHHFKTKDDILSAVIARRLQKTDELLASWEAEYDNPRMRIRQFLEIVIRNQETIMAHGCPVGTLCTELAKLDHAAKPHAAEIFHLFRQWLSKQFRLAGCAEDAEALALHALTWSQGVAVVAATLRDEEYIRGELEGITQWLETCLTETAK